MRNRVRENPRAPYRFDADANFEGRRVGALEGMESGGALRIVEAPLAWIQPEADQR